MVQKLIENLVLQYEEALPNADPRTKDRLLVHSSPVYVWAITILYLTFIWLGPKYMRNRTPYDLKPFMFVYNLALVALSVYMFVEIILSTWDAGYPYWGCAPYNKDSWTNPKETRVAAVMWWYFFSKAIELMDTVLMVLRKKNNQITFLHVMHHSTMLNIWWWVVMFIPGGLSFFGSGLNCLVHVAMYSYYGLSVIPSLRGKLWWKHYITEFQLTQFCATLTHVVYAMLGDCDFPRWGMWLVTLLMLAMLVLFSNFYIHAYVMRRKQKTPTQKAKPMENGVQNGSIQNGNAAMVDGSAAMTNGYASGDKMD